MHNPHPLMKASFIMAGIGLVILGIGVLWVALTPIPALNSFDSRKVAQSTKIYDRSGKTVLYDLNHDVKRNVVPLSDISPYLQQATISIEDSNFYHHGGVSFTGTARSLIADITTLSFSQGGSTLTQQVVKNTILSGQKSIIRKAQEWILAFKFEQKYSKDQILEFYFNVTPYGGTLYGAEVASRAFYGKSAKDLDLAEAAYMAAIPQLPTYYSPYGNNRAALDARKNLVLDRMLKLGYINNDQYNQAKKETVTFSRQMNNTILAPHFVFYIEQYLENKYGPDVATQGLTVITTIDADLQHQAETIVNQYALANTTKFKASNAALVAIDPKTGQILSMVGSRNYFDTQIDGNYNAALASRQPGSSFKPFVYAAALLKGYTPQTAIFDLPTQFSTSCSPSDNFNDTPPCYSPGNYDGKFRGPMTFTTALAQSINVPAVKTLYLDGIPSVVNLATSMGITTLGKPSAYGLSLALGAAEVRLLDLTSAYGAFANDGRLNPATGILSITDKDGHTLEQYTAAPKNVLNPDIAHEMSAMLSDNAARQPEYPPVNPFTFPGYDVAAKTGTTNESRDAWTIGYTPSIAIGVWAGNNDNSPMVKEIAGYIVAPMWHEVMQYALTKYPNEVFPQPPAIPDTAPAALRGIYTDGTSVHDILYWVNKNDPMTPGSSTGDGQYPYWEFPIANWLAGGGLTSASTQTTATSSDQTAQGVGIDGTNIGGQ
ncbi:MAG: putative penicillin-binding protein [Parcubacteria group bacterium]|nr:putative penicillin-binding protein [Parcubacteria group bacterium]